MTQTLGYFAGERDHDLTELHLFNAYLAALQMPHGPFRVTVAGQKLLADLRDALATVSGRDAEEVQNQTEAIAASLTALTPVTRKAGAK